MILSGEHTLRLVGGKTHETGFFLNELSVPLRALVAAGYTPIIATPGGRPPAMDVASATEKYFHGDRRKYLAAGEFVSGLNILAPGSSVIPLGSVTDEELAHYSAVFVPGGQAPMIELFRDPQAGRILRRAHALQLPTALICHGPVTLLSARDENKPLDWIYRGYRMTVFSDEEESRAESKVLGGKLAYYPEDALRAAGGLLEQGPSGAAHIVQDRELLTGQNPASDEEFSTALLTMLDNARKP